eukprot:4745450-Prymnesium_polylepis.3
MSLATSQACRHREGEGVRERVWSPAPGALSAAGGRARVPGIGASGHAPVATGSRARAVCPTPAPPVAGWRAAPRSARGRS